MENIAQFQRKELIRLKEENVSLRNAAVKLVKNARRDRATISVLKKVNNNLHARLMVADGAYGIMRGE